MYCLFLGFYDWIFTLSVGIYCNYARKQKRHPVISNRVAHEKCYINIAKVAYYNIVFRPSQLISALHASYRS